MRGSVFSESWFKVAKLNVSLNTNSYIKKQIYRGDTWYVIEDSYNNQFFKIKPEAYEFIIRLDSNKTVEEVWEECLEILPQIAPTQDEVISLLTSLHHKNLLYFKNRSDNQQLVQRSQKRKSSELKGKIFSFLYFKIPLIDPDNWLNSTKPFINRVFSKTGFIIWAIVLILGLKYTVENFSLIYDQTQGMLSPNNLFLLYLSIIVLKSLHELGHAMMVKKFGGRVNQMGVMILIFTPIPFMDATQSWLFRSKYQRALVGAAGMIVELFFAAIAAIIWANTGDGIIHSISFNMMIIGSVSSIFFNGNPLLRFDSYFILSDLLEIPNLYDRSKKQWYYLIEKYIFRLPYTTAPSNSTTEAIWMYIYAILSLLYRLFVALVIAVFVADQWFVLGVAVVIISLYMWVVKPLYGYFKYILTDVKFKKSRYRTIFITSVFVTFLVLLLGVIPFSFSIKANGIVLKDGYSSVFIKTEGYLRDINVSNGTFVKKGEVVAILENKEIDFEIASIYASIEETKAYMIKARDKAKADMSSINMNLELLDDKLKFLNQKKEQLKIKANTDGYFVYENIKYKENTWFKQGVKIGTIIPNDKLYLQAVVLQEEAHYLFENKDLKGSIKLHGLNDKTIKVSVMKIIPFQKQELPSAALGWLGGGDIATSNSDSSGTKAMESFFEVRADIVNKEEFSLLHGRSGVLKIELTPRTITQRVILSLKQILQKHYKI